MGCSSIKYVNVEKRKNFYQRNRYNTYTIPVWIPGVGVLLETRIHNKTRSFRVKPIRNRK